MTIRRLDPSIHAVDDQFCFLVLTDFSTCIHSLLLCFIMTARSLSTATFDIPSTVWIMNNMMHFSCHTQFTPYALWGSRLRIPPFSSNLLRSFSAFSFRSALSQLIFSSLCIGSVSRIFLSVSGQV